ncbi:MAG TPA: acyltransferase [Pricia antarctica]|uniref:Acyltransferase n=1 Tax=Pricia antarctica TaxID=641691 RepID=A0A831QMY5_9FLAO|nr:acyltransferase [Pricia antarctica]
MTTKLLHLDLDKDRIYGLDYLRFWAIMLVLISHGRWILRPIFGDIEFMSIGGFWGVELFFVLSGFLIGGILIRIFEREKRFDFEVIVGFWKRRWFRTLPNYYLIFFLNALLAIVFAKFVYNDIRYYAFLLFLQNFFTEHPHFFEEAWSLAVEEWFYLSFPVFLIFVNRFKGKTDSKKITVIKSILFLLLLSLLLKILVVSYQNPNWDTGIRKIVPLRLDSVLTGVFFAWIKYYYVDFYRKYTKAMLCLAVFLLIVSAFYYYTDIIQDGLENTSWFSKTFIFTITSLGFALLLPYYSETELGKPKGFFRKAVTKISLVSYSAYLIHFSFVLLGLSRISKWNNTILFSLALYLFYFGITFFFSILLYKFYERPMTDLRDYSPNSKGFKQVRDYAVRSRQLIKKSFSN